MDSPEVNRVDPPRHGDERTQLDAWLNFHRGTLLNMCAGLSAWQLKMRAAEPSSLSLLGLIRHMADSEHYWFRRQFRAAPISALYWDNDGDFRAVDDAEWMPASRPTSPRWEPHEQQPRTGRWTRHLPAPVVSPWIYAGSTCT